MNRHATGTTLLFLSLAMILVLLVSACGSAYFAIQHLILGYFLIEAYTVFKPAAAHILRGLDRRGFEVHFPARLSLALKLLAALPYGLSLPLTRRLVR